MKNRGEILQRLLRAATRVETEGPQMPFGFDTRVLALAHEEHPNGSAVVASLARGAAMVAALVIAVATVGLYRASVSNAELPNGYAIADSAIQSHLGE